MASKDGRCKTFDAGANGYVRGEGAGIVLLKRLSHALRDGDRIYAVIRGSATNNDGRSAGITAPSPAAQESVLRDAYARAGIDPSSVDYVEAHGTGTPLGDPIEVNTLGRVFTPGRLPSSPLRIGSVKTNIGHLENAAGVAGLIKVALSLHHRALPPSLHFTTPNPAIAWDDYPLVVQTELTRWPERAGAAVAGVSSFGFGGSNAHVVLEEAPSPTPVALRSAGGTARLLTISAASEGALAELAADYAERLQVASDEQLDATCWTAATRRAHLAHRLAVLGRDLPTLLAGLRSVARGTPDAAVAIGRSRPRHERGVAFVFSGQGGQWSGMARALLRRSAFVDAIAEVDALLETELGWSVVRALDGKDSDRCLADTAVAQPALFAVQIALARLWASWGVTPKAIVGHSVGEIAGACVAGVLTLADAAHLVAERSRLMQPARDQGSMLAADLAPEAARRYVESSDGRLAVAAFNAPERTVLAGERDAIESLRSLLDREGITHQLLRVGYAFHSSQMDPFVEPLERALGEVTFRAPEIPLVSTMTGDRVATNEMGAAYWGRQLRAPVRFADAVGRLLEDGFDTFVEIGPHAVLASCVAECGARRDREVSVLPSMRREVEDEETILRSLGALYVNGHDVRWEALFRGGGSITDLPLYRFQHRRFWSGEGRFARVGPTANVAHVPPPPPPKEQALSNGHPIDPEDVLRFLRGPLGRSSAALDHDLFAELGLGSLELTELVSFVEGRAGKRIRRKMLSRANFRTARSIVALCNA
jgi:acyl transferase domain-containing protein